jgi:hypothetical protein
MPTTEIRGDTHRRRKNMQKKTNRTASRHMREMAKAKARALEVRARMYAAGIWPVIPPPFIITKLPLEEIARLIANLKEAGRWPLPSEHPASAILIERENERSKGSKIVAVIEAQFPSKATADNEASRATLPESTVATRKRGRKPVVTPERINTICELLARGESERSACIRAGIGSTAWGAAKRNSGALRERIARARDQWAKVRHARHAAALYESQATRSATRKALKPQPTHQAKLVVWHLTTRLPLNVVAIPEAEIERACERFNLPLKTWRGQERAFGLLQKVYAKRAAIRGQQQSQAPASHNLAGPAEATLKEAEAIEKQPEQSEPEPQEPRRQPKWVTDWIRASNERAEPEPEQPDDGVPRLG